MKYLTFNTRSVVQTLRTNQVVGKHRGRILQSVGLVSADHMFPLTTRSFTLAAQKTVAHILFAAIVVHLIAVYFTEFQLTT